MTIPCPPNQRRNNRPKVILPPQHLLMHHPCQLLILFLDHHPLKPLLLQVFELQCESREMVGDLVLLDEGSGGDELGQTGCSLGPTEGG
jgi:hypothetical protein